MGEPQTNGFKGKQDSYLPVKTYLYAGDKGAGYSINFKQLAEAKSFSPIKKVRPLPDRKKYFLIFKQPGANIKSRSKFLSACRHKSKPILCNSKVKKPGLV